MMDMTSPRSTRRQFNDNIKCREMPFRSNFCLFECYFSVFLRDSLLPFEVIMIRDKL